MFVFNEPSRNVKKIYRQRVIHFLSYGTTSDSNDVSGVRHDSEDATIVSDGSASDYSSTNKPVRLLNLIACDGVSGSVVCFDSCNTDVEAQTNKVCLESFESDDESSSLIKSVAALQPAKKFTDSETTASTQSTEYSASSVKGDAELPLDDTSSRVHCSFHGCGRGLHVPGWKTYNRSLESNPVPTKAITSFCGWFLGDLITQTMLTRDHVFDFRRSVTMSSFGLFFHGPIGHFVYDHLDCIVIGTGPREVVSKILIDQLLWCPIFMICYFSYLGICENDPIPVIVSKIQQDLFTAITTSWKIWPLAHAIQFRWVATKHRIIYINCIEVCFIMFLSFLANR